MNTHHTVKIQRDQCTTSAVWKSSDSNRLESQLLEQQHPRYLTPVYSSSRRKGSKSLPVCFLFDQWCWLLFLTDHKASWYICVPRLASGNLQLWQCEFPAQQEEVSSGGSRGRLPGQPTRRGAAVQTEARLLVCSSSPRQVLSIGWAPGMYVWPWSWYGKAYGLHFELVRCMVLPLEPVQCMLCTWLTVHLLVLI